MFMIAGDIKKYIFKDSWNYKPLVHTDLCVNTPR